MDDRHYKCAHADPLLRRRRRLGECGSHEARDGRRQFDPELSSSHTPRMIAAGPSTEQSRALTHPGCPRGIPCWMELTLRCVRRSSRPRWIGGRRLRVREMRDLGCGVRGASSAIPQRPPSKSRAPAHGIRSVDFIAMLCQRYCDQCTYFLRIRSQAPPSRQSIDDL